MWRSSSAMASDTALLNSLKESMEWLASRTDLFTYPYPNASIMLEEWGSVSHAANRLDCCYPATGNSEYSTWTRNAQTIELASPPLMSWIGDERRPSIEGCSPGTSLQIPAAMPTRIQP